jgi:hypothetical protein
LTTALDDIWIAYADAAGRASTDINLGGHAIVDHGYSFDVLSSGSTRQHQS